MIGHAGFERLISLSLEKSKPVTWKVSGSCNLSNSIWAFQGVGLMTNLPRDGAFRAGVISLIAAQISMVKKTEHR